MGIKGSPTVVLNFDRAKGYLVGEKNKGLEYMFTYMNTARVGIAIQGLCHAELAYQASLPYAKERLSMRALSGAKYPENSRPTPLLCTPMCEKCCSRRKRFQKAAGR